MNLQKLKTSVAFYKDFLKSDNRHNYLFLYEVQKNWQEYWDLDAANFLSSYEQALQSDQTRRLWNTTDYAPKHFISEMIKFQKNFVAQSFLDLFNEDKGIDGRIERFAFYCGEMLSAYRDKFVNTKLIDSYHDDYRIISLYLSGEYPDKYAYYVFEIFREMLILLSARDIPKVHDMTRYYKVLKIIFQFIEKDTEIEELHLQRLNPNVHYKGRSLTQAFELMLVNTRLSI